MSKTYKYVKDNEILVYNADDREEKYLEENKNLTGVTPSDFISFYVKKYPNLTTEMALMYGFKDNLNTLTAVDNFSNIKLDLDYKNVKKNLSEMTKKLDRNEDVINQIIEEVRENK